MLLRSVIAISVALLIPVLLVAFVIDDESNQAKYACPPCGCSHDHLLLDGPGKCEACSMTLYQVSADKGPFTRISEELFRGTNNMLYNKLIYPSFFIGIVIGILFITGIRDRNFNPFLGGIILSLGLYGFKNQIFGVNYGLSSNFEWIFTPISTILSVGPLAYFYVRSIKDQYFKWKKKYWVHFLPAILIILAYGTVFFLDGETKIQWMLGPFEAIFGHPEQFAAVISGLLYLFYSTEEYDLFKKQEEAKSYTDKWLQRFVIGLSVFFGIWLFSIVANFFLFDMGVATQTYNPLWFATSLFIFWVIVEVMLNPKHFFRYKTFQGNGHSTEKINEDKNLVISLMNDEKPYLDQELSLDKLAEKIELNPKYLSQVINFGFNKNFYEFINEYRVKEVKVLLKKDEYKHLTIAAIANEAGFKSKSSFNSAFKKHTKQTPKEYIRSQTETVS